MSLMVGRSTVLDPAALPAISRDVALFLDVDGTLADLMARPEDVRIAVSVQAALAALEARLSGALAIVTGRTIHDIDRLFSPRRFSVAGVHGCEMRLGRDTTIELSDVTASTTKTLSDIAAALRPFVADHDGVWLEEKPLALSLHYRARPEHGALCWQVAAEAVRKVPTFEARPGKMVVEIVPAAVDKGTAIRRLMSLPPFVGRTPIFVGDDVGDEPAIVAVQALGGIGIRIVEGAYVETAAAVRLTDAAVVRAWLVRNAEMITEAATH
jgi:trehalose 6-phosphate phosphatase